MIRFLLKGIIRDKGRSVLPVIIISIGVFLSVFMTCWLSGITTDMIDLNANFSTGHVRVMTRAYAENADQMPIDLALLRSDELTDSLKKIYPEMNWVQRIRFGCLLDIPDKNGETRAQGPAFGMAVNLLTPGTGEAERLNIGKSIVSGNVPDKPGEVLVSYIFAEKFNVHPGDEITLFGSTMYNAMTFGNYKISGTVRFGSAVMDRGAVIIDLADARNLLDMDDAAGEILGYYQDGVYHDKEAGMMADHFNKGIEKIKDEYSPEMLSLRNQNQLSSLLDYMNHFSGIFIFIFVCAMSIVLWNTGLLGGLRRYNEFGVRLAMGEEKRHIYHSLLYESAMVGVIGSVVGTVFGLCLSYFIQEHGLHFGNTMKNASMMLPGVFKASVVPEAYFIGFIPGVLSMVVGNALSGIGIYKRDTARLFKELEV